MTRARDLDGLPERITAVRQKLGLAQRAFSARVGVSRNVNAVIRYEGGHGRPRADTLERIAQLGGVSVDWLLRGDRRPPERPREWDDAVRLLRAAWLEPSRRELGAPGAPGDGAVAGQHHLGVFPRRAAQRSRLSHA